MRRVRQFASDCFYGGAIADGVDAADRPEPRGFAWPRPGFPVAFVPLPNGVEHADGRSKANQAEARVWGGWAASFRWAASGQAPSTRPCVVSRERARAGARWRGGVGKDKGGRKGG